METKIRFGTDGWRGLIAHDFTFENVSRCAQGVCDYINQKFSSRASLVVGYDTRFLSKEFAETVAKVGAANGLKIYLSIEPLPTPVLSFNVLDKRAAGGIVITASHNPGVWNGFKYKPEYGGSATQEITDSLEYFIERSGLPKTMSLEQGINEGLIIYDNPAPVYIDKIASLIDLDLIRQSGLYVVVDAMFGAGAGFFPRLLEGGTTTVKEINGYANPAFPGMEQPEPIDRNLTALSESLQQQPCSVGLALDGDADRLGVIDEYGSFISTLEVFSLLALYLLEEKGLRGDLVKGVTSSLMLNKLAQQFGVGIHEMRVGFKYIGPKMSEINALIAGEESGGFAFKGHIPERDGVLSGLYILEYMAKTGRTPSQLIDGLFNKVGFHCYRRRDITFDNRIRGQIEERLSTIESTDLGGGPIIASDSIDGKRLMFTDGWLASRFSGTEPLLRIYCESSTEEKVNRLLDAAQSYLGV